jgi:alanine racemase
VLNTPDEVRRMGGHDGAAPAALHVDTGMTRLGLSLEDARQPGCRSGLMVAALNLTLVMSHPACADEPDHALNAMQIALQ